MIVDKNTHYLQPLRAVLSLLVYPVESIVNIPNQLFHHTLDSVGSYDDLLTENKIRKRKYTLTLTFR